MARTLFNPYKIPRYYIAGYSVTRPRNPTFRASNSRNSSALVPHRNSRIYPQLVQAKTLNRYTTTLFSS